MKTIKKKVIDFGKLIAQSTENYVGREWVCNAVDDFLKTSDARCFLLLGEPGSGKTAFMAEIVRRRKYPHHFIGKGCQINIDGYSDDWHNPVRFAESVGYQLVCDHGGWIMSWEDWGISVKLDMKEVNGLLTAAKVDRFNVRYRPADKPMLAVEEKIKRFGSVAEVIGVFVNEMKMDVEQIVRQLLKTPLWNIAEKYPEDKIVVIVDGLDEAESYSNDKVNIFKMLPDGELPGNVRFLLSSRPGEHLDTHDLPGHVHKFWLSMDEKGHRDPRTIEDAKAFTKRLAAEEPVHSLLKRRGILAETFTDRVAKASQGNFLYLQHYAQGLRDGDDALLDLKALPEGLDDIYWRFLKNIRKRLKDVGCFEAYQPVLGVLAVAREAMTQPQIAGISEIDLDKVGTVCIEIEQFLDIMGETVDEARYAIYHRSFSEYVISRKKKEPIDGNKAHRRIIKYYQRETESWKESYAMKYLLFHMIAAESWKDVEQLLTNMEYLERKHDPAEQYRFQTDFIQLLQAKNAPIEHILESILNAIIGQTDRTTEDRKRKADWLDTFAYWINEFGVKDKSERSLVLKKVANQFDEACADIARSLTDEYLSQPKPEPGWAMRFAELRAWVYQRAQKFEECIQACHDAEKKCRGKSMGPAYKKLARYEFMRMRANALFAVAKEAQRAKRQDNMKRAEAVYEKLSEQFAPKGKLSWKLSIKEWEQLASDTKNAIPRRFRKRKPLQSNFKAIVVSNAHDCISAMYILQFLEKYDGCVEWIHHEAFKPDRITWRNYLFLVFLGGPKAPGISAIANEFFKPKENKKPYLRMYSGLYFEEYLLQTNIKGADCYMLGGISKVNTMTAAYEFTTDRDVIKIIKEHGKS